MLLVSNHDCFISEKLEESEDESEVSEHDSNESAIETESDDESPQKVTFQDLDALLFETFSIFMIYFPD